MIKYVVFHPWRAALVILVGTLTGLGAFYAYQLGTAFGTVASEEFDPARARVAIESEEPDAGDFDQEIVVPAWNVVPDPVWFARLPDPGDPRPTFNRHAFGEPIPGDVFDSYLLLGADGSGALADAIILVLQPTDGANPIMVSLPRDLYVWNMCRGRFTRLNAGLGGCRGVASGSELMAIMVEDYTGIPIDHLARVDFEGFARVVDTMGGTTICVDHPTRDPKASLDLPEPGCRNADGATTLAWVRSRDTEQLRDGEWVVVAGSDFARQRRQQDVLFQMAGRAANFPSPGALTSRLSAVSSSVRLDSSWTFGEAVATAWRYRGVSPGSVSRFTIAVSNYRAPGGAAVLLPSRPFKDQLEEVYPLG